jgi:YHS domain-containing protein
MLTGAPGAGRLTYSQIGGNLLAFQEGRATVRRIMWTLATVVVMNGALAAIPVLSEDRPPAVQEPAGSSKAKIGDQVACAVDGMKMALTADMPSTEYRGTVYYFCSEDEKRTFLKDPERYTKH